MYTASTALIEALQEGGVSYIFANFGSDHPAFVEAVAKARAEGRSLPSIITCPNEMVGMSCAHGYAQLTGRAQAVVVHVECGTQALGGAVHNAAKGRVPMFIFAGLSPFTQDGELTGSRNEFIQWIQDVYDQRGIVREYMKYNNELRTPHNVKPLVHRALQFAHTEPRGPVYIVGGREVMEAEGAPLEIDVARWAPVAPVPLAQDAAREIVEALAGARRPLVVTSYLGRNPEAPPALVRLCRRLGVGVLESVPNVMNYPHDDSLYQGNQWNQPVQNRALAEADVIVVIDSDVPWIPTVSRPAENARIFHIDIDPLKEATPLWYIRPHASHRADAATALGQMADIADGLGVDDALVSERGAHYAARHEERRARLAAAALPQGDGISPAHFTAKLRQALEADTVVLNEGITNYPAICDYMAPSLPGTFFNSGGGSLGWNGGAAIGAKLARPEATVVALTGDGSYMFSVPSSVHWMARRYETPFLQVVFNNGGWRAPRFSALAVHPDGYASRAQDLDLSFEPSPDYAGIAAAAGGAFARRISSVAEVDAAIADALHAVRVEKRAAVLDVVVDQH